MLTEGVKETLPSGAIYWGNNLTESIISSSSYVNEVFELLLALLLKEIYLVKDCKVDSIFVLKPPIVKIVSCSANKSVNSS